MAIDYDSLENPTDEQLLIAVKHAITQLLLGGQSYSIAGVSYTRVDIDKLRKIQMELENKIAGTDSVTFVFGRFNRRV